MTRCMGCMAEIHEEEVCRYCGYVKGTGVKEAYYLLPGKVVGEKYMVGKVLGYGGFGVTYIGWDTILQRKVAIKEYLPSDFATRSYGTKELVVFSGEASIQFQAGLDSFISEAKRLAKFNRIAEIVDIYDCFMENDTGYIIMEFLEGMTVKEMLKKEEKIPVESAKKIVMSVLRGLSEVHREGIIHRDIAPDNIFITKTGEVKILDFGAARYATAVQSRSLSVILKPGYAPEEQYRSKGEQGPWTDVYALAATFYRMITGVRPEESIERMAEDNLKLPSELGVEIDVNTENAIMNGLNIKKEYRIADATSFYEALDSQTKVERIIEGRVKEEKVSLPLWIKITGMAAVVVAGILGVMLVTGNISFSKKQINSKEGEQALAENEIYVPNVSGMSYEEAEKILRENNLDVIINGMNYSESIEKDKILSQEPTDGAKIKPQETVYVIMSGGNEEVMMPELTGMVYEDAVELIAAQNLVLNEEKVTKEYSDVVEKGRIIEQNIKADERIDVKTEVLLTVSQGSLSKETKILTVPDLTGLTRKEALEVLEQLKNESGFTYTLGESEQKYDMEIEKDKIISQSLTPGSQVRTDKTIELVISKGPELVQVPQVVYVEEAEAIRLIEEAGLMVEVKSVYNSNVSKGLTVSQSQENGAEVAKGSIIVIEVSLGKKPVVQNTPPTPTPQQQPSQQPPQQVPSNPAPNKKGPEVVPDNGTVIIEGN